MGKNKAALSPHPVIRLLNRPLQSSRKCRTRLLFHARELLAELHARHILHSLARRETARATLEFRGATHSRAELSPSRYRSISLRRTRKCVLIRLLLFPRLPVVLSVERLSNRRKLKSGAKFAANPISDVTTPSRAPSALGETKVSDATETRTMKISARHVRRLNSP